MAGPKPPFRWDRARGVYRDASGRFVPASTVRGYLDSALESAGARVDALANQLRAGQIDLISWEVRMRREVKVVSTYSGAAAKGGWAQMTDADLGRVGRYLQDQYRFLRGFAQDVASGRQALNGTVNARAQLYTQSGRALHARMERAEMVVRGKTERRSARHAGDSCDGCVRAEAAGWHKIEGSTVTEIGQRECRTRCRCSWEYR
jgi:CubicO group peptidase (beta-lactamase class C family)